MGNQSTKHRAKGLRSSAGKGGWRPAAAARPQARTHVLPAQGDVVYPVKEVLAVSEGALDELRQLIAHDPEAFVLDNLLMATQYFRNHEEEVQAALAEARRPRGGRGAPLPHLPLRVLHADALAEVVAEHVQCRTGHVEPDERLVAAARHFVVSDNITLYDGEEEATAWPARGGSHRHHHHLAVEPGVKPGFLKLRRVHEVGGGGSRGNLSVLSEDDETVDALRMCAGSPRPRPPRLSRTPSPGGSPRQQRARPRSGPPRSTDSAVSSDGSLSWPSDGSSGRNEHEKRVPLDEFQTRTAAYLRSPPTALDLPRDCYQAVLTVRSGAADPDVDDEETAPPPRELRSESYLMAHPFVVRFAHVFHDTLAAALGVPAGQAGANQAALRVNNGPAAVLWEEWVAWDRPRQLALQHEAVPALPVAGWPLTEWVVRARGGWPAARTVREVHDLGCVAVPVVTSGADAHTLQWALASPAGERLLELSMSAPQAHAYLSLIAVLRAVPGLNAPVVRAFYLRHCESTPAEVESAASSLGWAPGRSLRVALARLYTALRQQRLPDYFVAERNLLRELPHKQIVRAQERLFRLQEQLVYRVLQACRRLQYVHDKSFYPRLQYDKLVALLAEPGGAGSTCSSRFTTPSHSQCSSASNSRKTSRNEALSAPTALIAINMNWAESFPTRPHASGASTPTRRSRNERNAQTSSVNQKWIEDLRRRVEAGVEAGVEAEAEAASAPRLQKHLSIKLGTNSQEAHDRTRGLLKLFCDQFIEMGKTSIKFKDYSQAYLYLRHSLHLLTLLEQDYGYIKDARDLLRRVRQAESELTDATIVSKKGRATYGSMSDLSYRREQKQPKPMFGSTGVL